MVNGAISTESKDSYDGILPEERLSEFGQEYNNIKKFKFVVIFLERFGKIISKIISKMR